MSVLYGKPLGFPAKRIKIMTPWTTGIQACLLRYYFCLAPANSGVEKVLGIFFRAA
jgi:hypothetical protein